MTTGSLRPEKRANRGDGVVTDLQLVHGLRVDIQNDLPVAHETGRHLHAGCVGVDRDLRREAAVEGPLVQGTNQVRTGGALGRHNIYSLLLTRGRMSRSASVRLSLNDLRANRRSA